MTLHNKIVGTLSLLSILVVQPANALSITDVSGLTGAINLIDFNEFTGTNIKYEGINGPENIGKPIGEDIQVSTTQDPTDLWLSDPTWVLGKNQQWNDSRGGFLGIQQLADTNLFPVKIEFHSGNISGFGFFMNYLTDIDVKQKVSISAWGSGSTLLEEFIISDADSTAINTPGSDNDGAFRGIQLDNANIEYIELSGYHAVFDDLQFTRATTNGVASVPEPGSILLLMLGLAGIGASTRSNKRAH